MSQTVRGYEPRFDGMCMTCGKHAPGDYIKYNFLGFELLYMICGDCYLHINIAGLSRLKAEVQAFREQLAKKEPPQPKE